MNPTCIVLGHKACMVHTEGGEDFEGFICVLVDPSVRVMRRRTVSWAISPVAVSRSCIMRQGVGQEITPEVCSILLTDKPAPHQKLTRRRMSSNL